MVRQLEVHGGWRALGADFHLEGVQGGLVGLAGQAQGQAGVNGREAGSVGGDEALRCGEVRGEGVGRQIRRGRQGADLPLQRSDGCGVVVPSFTRPQMAVRKKTKVFFLNSNQNRLRTVYGCESSNLRIHKSERPVERVFWSRLQADLVDFSQNTRGRNKYGLVVTDVFTREVATKALPDKRAETW